MLTEIIIIFKTIYIYYILFLKLIIVELLKLLYYIYYYKYYSSCQIDSLSFENKIIDNIHFHRIFSFHIVIKISIQLMDNFHLWNVYKKPQRSIPVSYIIKKMLRLPYHSWIEQSLKFFNWDINIVKSILFLH